MYLQYDNEGDLKTQILHGEPCRQGSLLDVSICFSEEDWQTIIDRHGAGKSVSMLLYLLDDEPINKDLINENATKRVPVMPYFNGLETFYKNFDKEKIFSLIDGEEYRMFKFKITLNAEPFLFGVKWLVPKLSFSGSTVEDATNGEIDSSEIDYEVLGPAQIYIEKTFGNAEEEEVSKTYYEELEKLLSDYGKKLGRGNVVFEGETIKPVSEDLPQVLEANYAKKLIQNSKGYVLLENDTYQDRLNNIYYEKDGFKSEGILFYKANQEAYLFNDELEHTANPIKISGICFVTSFEKGGRVGGYLQNEILITSDDSGIVGKQRTNIFYREIDIVESSQHPSGYEGVRGNISDDTLYYFKPLVSGDFPDKVKGLIANKIDRKITSGKHVYSHWGERQGEVKYSQEIEDEAIVQRTNGGLIFVPDINQNMPSYIDVNRLATNKKYVDSIFEIVKNIAGNVILEGDSYQDNIRNIYYEKDGFKSEGVFFNKANHEAYLLDANLELNLSPVNIVGVCFVASFMQPDSTANPDIYAQGEILISSDFFGPDMTGVFYREIYIRTSTEHPSGYVGVRDESAQQGRYYFTPIMDASVINKIRTLIQNLDRNMISQSQLDETNRNVKNKVDKKTTSGNYVYTHIGEVQGEARFSENAEANAIVQRTEGGYIYVPETYSQAEHPGVAMGSVAVNKAYVDLGVKFITASLIGEVQPSEEENGYKQVLTFKGLKGEDGTALTLFTAELSLPKTSLEITEDSSLFKYTFTLKDSKGNTLSTKTIDLPLEELVVDGSYNNVTKSIILTLKNGNTVDIPVGDLVEGLVNSTDLQNALDTKVDKVSGKGLSTNDLTNELVAKINSALQEHQPLDNYATLEQVNAKYTKPTTGIPKTDLESSVQSSLNKADTALQEHQDISGKVDKIEGKGLSTNDYTNTDKSKLDGLANIKSIGDNLSLSNGVLSATVQETVIDNKTIAKNAQGELYVKEFTYNNITMTPSELVQANTITFLEDGE